MLKNLWQDHKQFILLVGGGLVVFLGLNSCLSGYIHSADLKVARSRKIQNQVRLRHKELRHRYWLEHDRARLHAEHLAALEKEVCLRPDEEVQVPGESGTLLVEFNRAVDRTWAAVYPEAKSRGLELPAKLTAQDFGIRRDDPPERYREYYSYLEIVGRVLRSLVGSGITRFASRPELIAEEVLPVKANDDMECIYRGVGMKVIGPYEAFLALLEGVQEPGSFLQARIRTLEPAGGGEEGLLRGELDFYGFRLQGARADRGRRRARR